MFWESSGVVGFDLGPLLEGQMRTAELKSAYNSLIIGPRGFGALSLRWIQFASVLRCARSSFKVGFFPDKTYFFRDGGKNWIKPPFCRFKPDNTGQNWKKLI